MNLIALTEVIFIMSMKILYHYSRKKYAKAVNQQK